MFFFFLMVPVKLCHLFLLFFLRRNINLLHYVLLLELFVTGSFHFILLIRASKYALELYKENVGQYYYLFGVDEVFDGGNFGAHKARAEDYAQIVETHLAGICIFENFVHEEIKQNEQSHLINFGQLFNLVHHYPMKFLILFERHEVIKKFKGNQRNPKIG